MPQRMLSAVFLISAITSPCFGQGFVEHLEPPALERGKTTRVTAFGSDLGKALDIWTRSSALLPSWDAWALPLAENADGPRSKNDESFKRSFSRASRRRVCS